jgi:hypothetical protein
MELNMNKSDKAPEINEGNAATCSNCQYTTRAVGLGVGWLCKQKDNRVSDRLFKIPHRNHSCENFVMKAESH